MILKSKSKKYLLDDAKCMSISRVCLNVPINEKSHSHQITKWSATNQQVYQAKYHGIHQKQKRERERWSEKYVWKKK